MVEESCQDGSNNFVVQGRFLDILCVCLLTPSSAMKLSASPGTLGLVGRGVGVGSGPEIYCVTLLRDPLPSTTPNLHSRLSTETEKYRLIGIRSVNL